MKRILVLLAYLLLTLPLCGQTPNTYRFGYFAANMKPEVEIAIVHAATTEGRQPWALFAEWGPVMAEPHAHALYPPHTSTGRVRRGVVRTYRCRSSGLPKECLDWEPVGKPRNYVQVAEMGTFTKSLRPRSPGEKPIVLTGTLSDTDLLSLVDYMRSYRRPDDHLKMSGNDPIWKIERNEHRTVTVTFSSDGVAGCTATVRSTAGQWEVADCGCWVS